MDFMTFLKENLSHALPILICGFVATAIIAERFRALFWIYPIHNKKQFFDRLKACIMADRLMDAIGLCGIHAQSPIAQIVKEGLMRAHQPEEMIADGLALASSEALAQVTKRTSFLSMIANVATLLGLFGTILGLIHSFQAVGTADPSKKAELLANGIATAMNATMLGLAVAIPCMVAFSFLMNKTNRLSVELDQAATRTLDLLRQRYYGAETHGRPQPQAQQPAAGAQRAGAAAGAARYPAGGGGGGGRGGARSA